MMNVKRSGVFLLIFFLSYCIIKTNSPIGGSLMETREELFALTEKYLQSTDEKYYIADTAMASTKVVIFEDCPTRDDITASKPVSAMRTASTGKELFDEPTNLYECGIGVLYISNVPLYPTDEPTWKLIGPLEAIRLAPKPASEYLRKQFRIKMQELIENNRIKLIAFKREFFKRYYDDFRATAEEQLIRRLDERLGCGDLQIIPFPTHRIADIKRYEKIYNDFISAFDPLTKG